MRVLKEVTTKDDGRKLIYYTFADDSDPGKSAEQE
jgi:hypothetical protein